MADKADKAEKTPRPSDKVPSAAELEAVGEYTLLDHAGQAVPFKSLWSAADCVLVVFIRHFYCGLCQDYVQTLCEAISPETLPPSTSVAIIGCGDPGLIDGYATPLGCRFPVYADPERRVFGALGLGSTLDAGAVTPAYQRRSIARQALAGFVRALGGVSAGLAHKGGDMRQVGGEFVFRGGQVSWCWRMRTTRDHTEVPELLEVLGVPKA